MPTFLLRWKRKDSHPKAEATAREHKPKLLPPPPQSRKLLILKKPLTLRVAYWHWSPIGECPKQQAKLVDMYQKYMAMMSEVSSDYPWSVRAVPQERRPSERNGVQIVSIKVDFRHQSKSANSQLALQHSRRLWQALEQLSGIDEFQELFGNVMVGINMYPKHLESEAKIPFTNGVMVQKFDRNITHQVNFSEHPLAFMEDSGVIVSRIVRLVAPFMSAAGEGADLVLTFKQQIMNIQSVISDIGETLRADPNTNLEAAAKKAAEVREIYDDVYNVTISRLDEICKNKTSSGEDILEGLLAVHKILLVHSELTECSHALEEILKQRKKKTNIILGSVAGLATLYAVGFMVGGPAVPALAWLFSWITGAVTAKVMGIGAAGLGLASFTTIKAVLESGRFEQVTQQWKDLQRSIEKLKFLLATYWMEGPWKMQFNQMPVTIKEQLLRSFGVDPVFFAEKSAGYHRNLIADAFDEFKLNQLAIEQTMQDLYKDLGISVDKVYNP